MKLNIKKIKNIAIFPLPLPFACSFSLSLSLPLLYNKRFFLLHSFRLLSLLLIFTRAYVLLFCFYLLMCVCLFCFLFNYLFILTLHTIDDRVHLFTFFLCSTCNYTTVLMFVLFLLLHQKSSGSPRLPRSYYFFSSLHQIMLFTA